MADTYSGFITIIGATNAGKSTLINQIIGKKISITSHKVQTTRTSFSAIKMVGDKQLIFTDTPGIFSPNRKLDKAMVSLALKKMNEADLILVLIDSLKGITSTTNKISDILKNNTNVFIALNKIDLINKNKLLLLIDELSKMFNVNEIFMISALKNEGIDDMLVTLSKYIPKNEYFGEQKDGAYEQDEKIYLAEITREKIYKYLHEELPYNIFVITEKVDKDEDNILNIYQKIIVKTSGHKKILLGKNGNMIKTIGIESRIDIQKELNIKARLNLFVKIENDWENKEENYLEQGLILKK